MEVCKGLQGYFGEKAHLAIDKDNDVYADILEGYPRVIETLSPEQVDSGVCGGGALETLDGKSFRISVKVV